MPADIGGDGKITATTSNTKKYTVKVSNMYCFKSATSATSKANRAGTFKKGSTFYADPVEGKEDWYIITKGSYKGRYVHKNKNTIYGYNFVSAVDESELPEWQVNPVVVTEPTFVTEATVNDDGEPTSISASGEETTESSDNTRYPEVEMDSAFMDSYNGDAMTQADADAHMNYLNELQNGLSINQLCVILGLPNQFSPITDARTDGTDNLFSVGRVYAEKIVKYMPVLFITPGVPEFMRGFSKDQKNELLATLVSGTQELAASVLESDDYYSRYYSLKFAYVDYFKYVNTMLRSAALFLGIENVVPYSNNKRLGEFNWLYAGEDTKINHATKDYSSTTRWLGNNVGAIALYADCGTSVNDSFSNSTGESNLASTLGSVSDTGRELNFLVGNIGSLTGIRLNALTGEQDLTNNMDLVKARINDVMSGPNIFSNIINKAQTILAGGRLVFPEIWTNSDYGRSYSCSMKLIAPAGDKLSIYMNVLVPIYHLLAMCLPRESMNQAYYSPFLLRCYYKGLFHVDMGIMTGLSITKGTECEWTYDGLPTIADVSFEIKDLYQTMYMSKSDDVGVMSIMSNVAELDYIANSCGININDQEVLRSFKLWKLLKFDNIVNDAVYNNIFGNIIQLFNQKAYNLFAFFS